MVPILLSAALAAAPMVALSPRAAIALSQPGIRIGDVARIGGGAGTDRLRAIEIARMPDGALRWQMSHRALAILIRRAVPGLTVAEGDDALVTFELARRPAPVATGCFVTKAAVKAGAAITDRSVEPGTCGDASADIAYDRTRHAITARRDLPAGTPVGRLRPPPAASVAPGDALTLVARAGVVTVERPVTAMQPGRAGGKVFVRDGAGHIFAAPVAGDAQ